MIDRSTARTVETKQNEQAPLKRNENQILRSKHTNHIALWGIILFSLFCNDPTLPRLPVIELVSIHQSVKYLFLTRDNKHGIHGRKHQFGASERNETIYTTHAQDLCVVHVSLFVSVQILFLSRAACIGRCRDYFRLF